MSGLGPSLPLPLPPTIILSKDLAINFAKAVSKEFLCRWSPNCMALLNSWQTLKEHWFWHCETSKGNASTATFSCRINGCSMRSASLKEIKTHVEKSHLLRVHLPCPIRSCPESYKPPQLETHLQSTHSSLLGQPTHIQTILHPLSLPSIHVPLLLAPLPVPPLSSPTILHLKPSQKRKRQNVGSESSLQHQVPAGHRQIRLSVSGALPVEDEEEVAISCALPNLPPYPSCKAGVYPDSHVATNLLIHPFYPPLKIPELSSPLLIAERQSPHIPKPPLSFSYPAFSARFIIQVPVEEGEMVPRPVEDADGAQP
ncbi:hypothetical protein OF83DRAFT_1135937 [Amylostereum chailletii]|nr:hypothetical protein OF83DRAFT_1135937 [Amylostereum chailletii]